MKYLLVLNALSNNRGSEALIRGLVDILKCVDNGAEIVVAAGNGENKYPVIKGVDRIIPRLEAKHGSGLLEKARELLKFRFDFSFRYRCQKLISECKTSDRVLIIGADNYDITYKMSDQMKRLNDLVFSVSNGQTLLIDSSFDIGDLTVNVIDDIKRFHFVTVRESTSYENAVGKLSDNVFLFPDPAFVMNTKECSLPDGFQLSNTVGINLSELVTSLTDKNLIIRNYINVIQYITSEVGATVLLLPHVMGGADYNVLSELKEECVSRGLDKGKIILWDNEHNDSEQIKYVISKLRILITARTHASIAAYSTFVPTLVLGYSVKSKGIARDLFGTEEGFVVDYKTLTRDNDICKAFQWIEQNEKMIKKRLQEVIPDYQKQAFELGKLIKYGK